MPNELKRILIGLDTVFFKVLLSDLLNEAGHAVSFAQDDAKIIEIVKAYGDKIDLLIVDMLDPNVNGYELIQWLNDNGYRERLPVMAIIGNAEPAPIIQRLKSLGVAALISRSLTHEDIIMRINNLLYSKSAAEGVPSMRLPVSIPVEFAFDGGKHDGTILNLSDGGAYIYSPVTMPKDAQVGVRFSLPHSEKPIHARGVIKWSPSQHKTGGRGHGVKFTWLSDADAESLKTFVERERARIE